MTPQTLLHVPGPSVPVLQELADQAGVTPETYTEQSLRLGAYLALIIATCSEGGDLSVLFERPDGGYAEFELNFNRADETPVVNETGLEAFMFEFQPPDDAILEIDRGVMETARQLAEVFEVSDNQFLEVCYFLRWRWEITRSIGGAILMSDGEPDVYTELDYEF